MAEAPRDRARKWSTRAAPRIGEPNGPDCHGAFGAPHGRLRHNADADVAFDQTTDGIETSQLHPQSKRTPDAIGLVSEEPLDRTGAVEGDHIVVQHFGDRKSGGEART